MNSIAENLSDVTKIQTQEIAELKYQLNTERGAAYQLLKEDRDSLAEQVSTLLATIKTAAEQIRKCDYTPARSTLLKALSPGMTK